MLQLVRASRLSATRVVPSAAWRTAAVKGYATEQSSGPGLPGQKPMSEEEVNKTSQRLYEGDKVENAPKYKVIKPDKEQPAAEDINQGTGAERVYTPTSAGRDQDSAEPKGSPM